MKRILLPVLLAVVGSCSPAAAQTTIPERAEQITVAAPSADDTRQDFRRLLEQYPSAVGEILRRDPTLMARPDYMASYPDLAKFIATHPEIPRNVEYYLEGFGSWQNSRQLDPSFEALGVMLGGIAVGFVLLLFSGVIIWLVRAFIQHRRWLKASTVQAEFHTKLLDRLSTNEELIAYVQSPAGRRFLEAAPVRPDTESASFSAPVGSIVWSLMAGVVLTVLGGGFRYAGYFVTDDAQNAMVVVGVIILSLGLGFIFASLMAFAVSSRLGLFPPKAARESQSTNA